MNEILSAIEEHLQRRLSVSQLDYYQVIGLEPFCSDKSQIQSALEKAWETIRRSEDSNIANKDDKTQSLQLVNKLLKQAQTILLDATKKTAYDSQLAKLFESQKKQKSLGKETANTTAAIGILAKTTAKSAATDSAQTAKPNEAELLPTGDPMQPYIASVALPSTLSNYSVDKRRAELTELFPSLMHMSFQPEPTQEQAPAWLVAADRKPASSEPVPKSIDLVEQLRKSRRQRRDDPCCRRIARICQLSVLVKSHATGPAAGKEKHPREHRSSANDGRKTDRHQDTRVGHRPEQTQRQADIPATTTGVAKRQERSRSFCDTPGRSGDERGCQSSSCTDRSKSRRANPECANPDPGT
jgi:hypothetical protein